MLGVRGEAGADGFGGGAGRGAEVGARAAGFVTVGAEGIGGTGALDDDGAAAALVDGSGVDAGGGAGATRAEVAAGVAFAASTGELEADVAAADPARRAFAR